MADRLVAQGVGGLPGSTHAWRIVGRGLQETPDQMIGIIPTGGGPQNATAGFDRPNFQVLIRGKSTGGSEVETKVAAVVTALDQFSGVLSTGTNADYVDIQKQGDILWVGRDENHRPLYSVNFQALRERM